MPTCNTICTNALRKARQVSIGGTPSAEESAAALVTLQSVYNEFIATGAFGALTEVIIDAAYTAKENERILSDGGPFTVTLPDTIDDPATGVERPVRDMALVVNMLTTPTAYLYSAPSKAWQTLTSLALTSTAPLAERSEDGLASLLAVRLAGDYGGDVSAGVALAAGRFLSMISMKADRPRIETQVDYF